MVAGLPHTTEADGVCKPPEGAVFKRYGAERSGKKSRKTGLGECKEAERK